MARTCPSCEIPLTRMQYDGFPVWMCSDCCGHLIACERFDGVRRSPRRGIDELAVEAMGARARNTPDKLRCPKCRVLMTKYEISSRLDLPMDGCDNCDLFWFEGGKLALAQLDYVTSPQGQEDAVFRDRVLNMSPERQAQFEENIARLKAGQQDFTDILGETVGASLMGILFRLPG